MDWELWNEPDISYWRGTPEEYNKLYDYTADAVKRALPTARVGGPGTTGPGNAKAPLFSSSFWNTARAATTQQPARAARRSISSPITPRDRPRWWKDTCRWGSIRRWWTCNGVWS